MSCNPHCSICLILFRVGSNSFLSHYLILRVYVIQAYERGFFYSCTFIFHFMKEVPFFAACSKLPAIFCLICTKVLLAKYLNSTWSLLRGVAHTTSKLGWEWQGELGNEYSLRCIYRFITEDLFVFSS